MATGTMPMGPAGPAPPKSKAPQVIGYDQYIEGQLRKTRAQVKWVELCNAVMTLTIGGLVYLLLVALADHWVFSTGLGFWGRWICLAGLLAGGLAYSIAVLAPLVFRRINPVYAAHAIEENRPSLKNSLVNFLLLRSSRAGVSEAIYEAVERQAATRLSQVHVEAAIDRTKLIRIFAVLLGVVTICAAYTVFSPKNPLRTLGRVMFPWADIAVPTRVTVEEVLPGDATVFHDEFVSVQALIRGVKAGDPVTLFYSTEDGQLVDQAIAMQKPEGSYKYVAVLPAGSNGLKQNVHYHLAAGDALTRTYKVQVVPAPTIVVTRAELDFPKYTGLERLVQDTGDLKAIEGTRVTLFTQANQPIAKAHVDLDCKGNRNRSLTVSGEQAQVKFPLRYQADGRAPEFSSYQVRFTNQQGHENPQPIRHRVEILRDQPPEVKLSTPTQPQIELPLNSSLQLKVWARDVDYALSQVGLVAERVDRSGDLFLQHSLLNKEQAGEFEGTFTLRPEQLKLKVGDAIRIWGEARDNRQPDDDQPALPNRAETDKIRISIVAPAARDARQEQKQGGQAGQPQDQPADPRQGNGDQQPNQGQPGQKDPQNQQPQQGNQPQHQPQKQDNPEKTGGDEAGQKLSGGEGSKQDEQQRIDPVANPGEAFEKINEKIQQEQKQNSDQKTPDAKKQGDQSNPPQNQEPKPQEDKGKNNSVGGQQPQPGQEQGQQNQGQQQQNADQQKGNQKGQPSGEQGKPSETQDQKPMPGGSQQGGSEAPKGPQQSGGNASQAGNQQATNPDTGGKPQGPGEKPAAGDKPSNGSQRPGQSGRPTDEKPPTNPEVDPMQKSSGGDPMKAGQQARSGDNGPDSAPEKAKPAEGAGSEIKGSGTDKPREPGKPGENPDTKGGDRDNEKGDNPGAGQKATDNKPSPTPQEPNSARGEKKQKSPADSNENKPKDDEAKSPSGSKKQSDSNGQDQGDRSGGGKSGGGQTAKNKEGTGGAGNTTAADQGGKKAPGSGDGEVSPEGGDKTVANQPTGKSDPDQRSGNGTQQKQGTSKPAAEGQAGQGQTDAQQNSDMPPGKPPADSPTKQNQQSSPGGQAGDKPSGQPTATQNVPGGGADRSAEQAERKRPPASSEPQGDAANLDYANKATDLALEHLKDQLAKDKPDPGLLDKLGWSREDMQRFVDHWEKMKQQAKQPGPAGDAARQRLEDQMRGLGLRPQGTTLKSGQAQDNQRDLRQSRNIAAPADYAEQVKAYKQRLAKGQPEKGK